MKRGESVTTGSKWAPLSDSYKKIKASMNKGKLANLKLKGDLRESVDTRVSGNTITIGIFGDKTQKKKGYNHAVGDTLPKRQWIPESEETATLRGKKGKSQYNKPILDKIKGIINASKG